MVTWAVTQGARSRGCPPGGWGLAGFDKGGVLRLNDVVLLNTGDKSESCPHFYAFNSTENPNIAAQLLTYLKRVFIIVEWV